MFRVVSIIKEPHIGVSFIDKDGYEISDDYSGERYASIYECDYKIFVQDDEGYIGVYSEQYEELFGEKTAYLMRFAGRLTVMLSPSALRVHP